jgi:hypothetical protein
MVNLKKIWCSLDTSGLGWDPEVNFCQHGN